MGAGERTQVELIRMLRITEEFLGERDGVLVAGGKQNEVKIITGAVGESHRLTLNVLGEEGSLAPDDVRWQPEDMLGDQPVPATHADVRLICRAGGAGRPSTNSFEGESVVRRRQSRSVAGKPPGNAPS